ncbi:MAG: FliO/MopB family protein [Thermodesulfobacteriota bacterium]
MTGSYTYLLIKALLTLVFVLGLLAMSVYAIRFFMNRRTDKGGTGPGQGAKGGAPVKVLFTSFLGAKKNLAVVEVAGTVLVLGVTQSSISFLTKIEDEGAVEELKRHRARKNPLLGIFQGGL